MRLNHDCIRDILLTIEEGTPEARSIVDIESISTYLKDSYSSDEVLYHIRLLNDAGFLKNVQFTFNGGILQGLTWNGHQYLDNIRDKSAWDKLKDGTVDLSCMSLDVLGQLAKELALSLAKKKLGLN